MRALVLSGGGMFGAWQAGAWAALEGRFHPDLIVGASVGSLNGYFIACGGTPQQLREMWLDPHMASRGRLRENLQKLALGQGPRIDFALTVTDLVRLKPRIFRGAQVTWRHLAASCAVPLVMRPVKIDGRWYADGGLLNPLPVYAAVELGATRIVALNALPAIPSRILQPFAWGFRRLFGIHPAPPANVELRVLIPSRRLGGMRDSLIWNRERAAAWMEQGCADAKNHFRPDLF